MLTLDLDLGRGLRQCRAAHPPLQAQDGGMTISALIDMMNNLVSRAGESDSPELKEALAVCGDSIDKMLGRAVRTRLKVRATQAKTVLSTHVTAAEAVLA